MTQEIRRFSHKNAPKFQASKFLHYEFLIDTTEWKNLLSFLDHPLMFSTHGVGKKDSHRIEEDDFFRVWDEYIEYLQSGSKECPKELVRYCTEIMTKNIDAIIAIDLTDDRELICPYFPTIQMQLHRFSYSPDGVFRSMAFGANTVSWGVQLSYPMLYFDPELKTITNANKPELYSNAALFRKVTEWMRKETCPTSFIVRGQKVTLPIRTGKNCLKWISHHKELPNTITPKVL